MPWVVDTCVVLDVALGDAQHGRSSAEFLAKKQKDGLLICPVTFVELAPQFSGQIEELKKFLELSGIDFEESFNSVDRDRAAIGFSQYIKLKRQGAVSKRPVADILIGSFAQRFSGLISRNSKDFLPYFTKLKILSPNAAS